MAKSSGTTRASSKGSPRGLAAPANASLRAIRSQIDSAIAAGGADWGNTELVRLRIREEEAMNNELDSLAGKNGWQKGFNNIGKSFGEDSPVMYMDVSVSNYRSGIENGPYYQARVGGSKTSSNRNFTDEINALWNNDKRFKTAREAIRWAESQANRINKKYAGKI